jgi:hypothetical protein
MALKSSSRNGAKVTKIVGHTAEGARTKESLYRYFDQPSVMASSHSGIDADGVADWVPRSRAAWTLRNGNPYSVNAEICGFARWTRAQWLSTGIVDGCKNPRQMIRNFAAWIVREARALGIPLHRLSVAEWRAGKAGYGDHDDYTDATGDGTHWDMGEGFPWDVLASDIKAITTPQEDDMTPKEFMDAKFGGHDWYTALEAYADDPGTVGHFLRGLGQHMYATRTYVDTLETAVGNLNEQNEALEKRINDVYAGVSQILDKLNQGGTA